MKYLLQLLLVISFIFSTGCGEETQKSENISAPSAEEQTSSRVTTPPERKPGSVSSNPGMNLVPAKKFWSSSQIFYKDLTGDSSAAVYDAIKGQKYFDDTYIFVYATLEDMEGTSEYSKIEATMESTRLDDRIFIWVHLNEQKDVIFVKKLISGNIRDRIEEATNIL